MKIRYLPQLTTLAFLCFSVTAFAVKPDNPGGGGDGQEYPTYDVLFNSSGDLGGSGGTKWQSGQKQEGITYFLSDQQGGTGDMDLSYFRDPFQLDEDGVNIGGPFIGSRGANCFSVIGSVSTTPINAVQFYRNKIGVAIFKGSFIGHSEDGAKEYMYLFTLTGFFDDPIDWLPPRSTTVTIDSWELKLKKKREDNLYSDITCTGGGPLVDGITVSRN